MTELIAVVVVAEGEVEFVAGTFATRAEANSYANGVAEGAGLYGCGSCYGQVMPDIEVPDDVMEAYAKFCRSQEQ